MVSSRLVQWGPPVPPLEIVGTAGQFGDSLDAIWSRNLVPWQRG